jgi:formylmethanofuran dehydrogenase subunit A
VIRRGEIIVDDGELRSDSAGRVFHVSPDFDPGCLADIEDWFENHYAMEFGNYSVRAEEIGAQAEIACH